MWRRWCCVPKLLHQAVTNYMCLMMALAVYSHDMRIEISPMVALREYGV